MSTRSDKLLKGREFCEPKERIVRQTELGGVYAKKIYIYIYTTLTIKTIKRKCTLKQGEHCILSQDDKTLQVLSLKDEASSAHDQT